MMCVCGGVTRRSQADAALFSIVPLSLRVASETDIVAVSTTHTDHSNTRSTDNEDDRVRRIDARVHAEQRRGVSDEDAEHGYATHPLSVHRRPNTTRTDTDGAGGTSLHCAYARRSCCVSPSASIPSNIVRKCLNVCLSSAFVSRSPRCSLDSTQARTTSPTRTESRMK